jgi:EF-hand domain pair
LFSQIDGNGDGQITKSEFENALGAGGTNTAAADDVFSKLDTNGDGSVSLDELSSALKGKGGHHGHHHAASSSTSGASGSTDPLLQALQAGSSTSSSSTSSTSSGTPASVSQAVVPISSLPFTFGASATAAQSYSTMLQQQFQAMSLSV